MKCPTCALALLADLGECPPPPPPEQLGPVFTSYRPQVGERIEAFDLVELEPGDELVCPGCSTRLRIIEPVPGEPHELTVAT